ncbi:MAG TPA: sigma-70 family RNA polymerase sigma factor, partial [Flavisolibacter sp.]|nr:sigma-70 family RNA polymerase sigma factor [Flavisolibacter sp.]
MALDIFEKAVQQYTDTELVRAVLSGQTALFEILIRRYNPYLYKMGRSYGFNHQDTEDLMQETFISSYINLKNFAGRSSFKTWLIKIMLHQCYHKSHKHSYQKERPLALTSDNTPDMSYLHPHSDNSKVAITKELNSIIEACIQKLPHDYRTTFTLRELIGLSVSETADITQTTTA